MAYPDFVSDREGLERWREIAQEGSGHDMAHANKNTLYRFVQTVDNLERALSTHAARIAHLEERDAILQQAVHDRCEERDTARAGIAELPVTARAWADRQMAIHDAKDGQAQSLKDAAFYRADALYEFAAHIEDLASAAQPAAPSLPAINMQEVGRYLLGTGLQGSVGFEHHGRKCVMVARYVDTPETGPTPADVVALVKEATDILEAYSAYFQPGNPWGDRTRAALAPFADRRPEDSASRIMAGLQDAVDGNVTIVEPDPPFAERVAGEEEASPCTGQEAWSYDLASIPNGPVEVAFDGGLGMCNIQVCERRIIGPTLVHNGFPIPSEQLERAFFVEGDRIPDRGWRAYAWRRPTIPPLSASPAAVAEQKPKRGDIQVRDGKTLRFIELDDRGEVWEIVAEQTEGEG